MLDVGSTASQLSMASTSSRRLPGNVNVWSASGKYRTVKARSRSISGNASIQRYTNDHVAVRNGSHDWTLEFRGFRVLEHQRGSYLILDFAIADAPDPLPSEVRLTYDGIIEAMPDREALVIVETDSRWERYRRSGDRSIRYRAGSTSHVVSLHQISRRTGAAAAARHHWRRARRLTVRTARQLTRRWR